MKFITSLALLMSLFMNFSFNSNEFIVKNTSKIPKIMDSIKNMFKPENNEKNSIIVLDENKTNKIKIDDLIITTLKTDSTSGFFWQYEISEPSLIDIVFENYSPGKDIKSGSGKKTFIFKSLGKGKCDVKFKYYKQGESSPIENIIYKISVK